MHQWKPNASIGAMGFPNRVYRLQDTLKRQLQKINTHVGRAV